MQAPPSPPPPSLDHIVPTQEGYDLWSAIYDQEDNPLILLEERELPPLVGDPKALHGRHVADIGCGTGRHTLPLAQAGAHVTALDFSAGMLARAREKAAALPVRFLEHDLTQPLPLPPAAFDLVLNCLVLEHLPDPPRFFAELARICRPQGHIVISVMHPAMLLRGVSARFTNPQTGAKTYPQSHRQQIADYVMAATHANLRFDHMSEHAVDEELLARSVSAARYQGWPMLLLMRLRPASPS